MMDIYVNITVPNGYIIFDIRVTYLGDDQFCLCGWNTKSGTSDTIQINVRNTYNTPDSGTLSGIVIFIPISRYTDQF